MAPFLVGDFVTFSGIKRGNEVVCFSIVANNVQILTLQNLVYVRMELGKLGIANFNPNTELGESRVSLLRPLPSITTLQPPSFLTRPFIVHWLHLQQPCPHRPLRHRYRPLHGR